MYYKKMRKLSLWLISLRITNANWWGDFPKKVTEWLFDDSDIIPNEMKIIKIYYEVISNIEFSILNFVQ